MLMPLRLRRGVLALVVLGPPAAVRAQEVFVRVPVELGGTATRSTLPFSEPFLLVGAAPGQLRQVDARFEMRGSQALTAKHCEGLLADPRLAGQTNAWIRDPQLKVDSFAVLVMTGLRANRRYDFCMATQSVLDSTALTGFQSRVYAILDSAYRSLDTPKGPPTNFPAAKLPGLKQELARALPRDQGEIRTTGTIFDTLATGKNLEENLIFTTGVLEAQRARFNAARSFTGARDLANQRLGAFRNDAALRAIAGTLTRRDRVSGVDSAAFERVAETARVLAFADPRLRLAAAGGEAVLRAAALLTTQPQEPDSITDPEEVARRAARLDSTALRLAELRDFTAALGASTALRRRTGVSPDASLRLRTRLEGLLETFDQLRRNAARWAAEDTRRRGLLARAARTLKVTVRDQVPVVATTISSFETRAKQYITADAGVAYAPGIGEVVPYFGANFYPGALNKRVPLSVAKPPELDRWALTVGVTVSSLAHADVRNDLFSSFSLLLGAGRRMTDPLRLTGGVVVYRSLDVNPLVDRTSIAASPFVSLSLDFDARSALGKVGDVLFH
jgi:hypothetical protein